MEISLGGFKMNNKIKCFIFSWKGQYENALNLEKQLSPLVDVEVINSDDDNKPEHWVNIGDQCYFSEQFRVALSLFDSENYDFFFHVQADASYDDWSSILDSAKYSYEKYNWGVFAPNVDDTYYVSSRTDVFPIEEPYRVVANTDNTCWFVHKDMIKAINSNLDLMEDNELGWGWDLLICAFAHINKRYVIRDYSRTVKHPYSSGYKKDQAEQEMIDMFNKTNGDLKIVLYHMKMDPTFFLKVYGVEPEVKNASGNEILIYDTERR